MRNLFFLFLLPAFLFSCSGNEKKSPAPDSLALPELVKEMSLEEIVFDIQQMIPDTMMEDFYYLYFPDKNWKEYKANSPAEVWDTVSTKPQLSHTPAAYFAMMAGTMKDTLYDRAKLNKLNLGGFWEEEMFVSYSSEKCAYGILQWLDCARPQFMKTGWAEKEKVWRKNLERIRGDFLR